MKQTRLPLARLRSSKSVGISGYLAQATVEPWRKDGVIVPLVLKGGHRREPSF